MKYNIKENSDLLDWIVVVLASLIFIIMTISIIWGLSALYNIYHIWSERKSGEAELARAESNRQIKTLEAKALLESSRHLANAEIVRAEGVAEANRIIGDSLKENESYLRYLWIQNLANGGNQVIYVPTEASLPILEAQRLK
jgi:hypothetical protein